jgi:hypothetical protein
MDLLGGRVLMAAAKLAKDHETLRRDPLATGVEQSDEVI